MTVPFNQVPGNTLVPFFWAEINSGGTPFSGDSQLLLIGQMTSAGTATAGVPYGPISSEADAIKQFGLGSMLVGMYDAARLNAPTQPIWALPLADPSGVAATGTVVFTAPGVSGTAYLALMGRLISWGVNAADNATTIGAAAAAAVNAANLPVTATATTGTLTVTARHVGALGNTIDIANVTNQPNVLAPANSTITGMASGTGVPTLTTPLANLGSLPFDWIAAPYSDATSLNAMQAFLNDSAGRWSPSEQLYGHYFTVAPAGNLSTQATLGASRNNQHETIVGVQVNRTPSWERAAAWGGIAVTHLSDAPELSRPLQTLVLSGVLPPFDRTKWWAISDRQVLYTDGIAAEVITPSGQVTIDRAVTTYKTNAAGAPDATFRDVETMAQCMFATRYFKTQIANEHGRKAFAATNPFNVSAISTPDDIRVTLIHAANDLVALGVIQDATDFASFLVVQQNPSNPNRCDAYLPIEVVNQLRIFAANITAFLQYASPSGAPLAQLANP